MDKKIIAYIGKGGTGKTILSALTCKYALDIGLKVLVIDADPAMGLATALDLHDYKTVGEAREEIIENARKFSKGNAKEELSEIIDYIMLDTLHETDKFSAIIMGHTNTIGCYCPVNNILRDGIRKISCNYELVIIDAEAGIEQINRQVTQDVEYPILVTDNTLRGVNTSILAYKTIKSSKQMNPKKVGVIFNRVNEVEEHLLDKIKNEGLYYYGNIVSDTNITENDKIGKSALSINEKAKSYLYLSSILKSILGITKK